MGIISPHNVVQHCSHTETYTKDDWQVEEGEEEPRQLVCCGQLTSPLGWHTSISHTFQSEMLHQP